MLNDEGKLDVIMVDTIPIYETFSALYATDEEQFLEYVCGREGPGSVRAFWEALPDGRKKQDH